MALTKPPPQPSTYGSMSDEEEDEHQAADEEPIIMDRIASFDKFTVWGHEALPSQTEDCYVKGIDEFMTFAKAVSGGIAFTAPSNS